MNEINITSAKYVVNPMTNQNDTIKIVVDGVTMDVPPVVGNTHYDEIMRQVDAGELTIADAE
jgi:hypothetical protein